MTLRPEPYRHLERARVYEGLTALGDDARRRGVAIGALAIAWALRQPRVDAAIVGPRTVAHLDEALTAIGIALSTDEAAAISAFFERA
jgi:aryl-alcohol dehydrogenase-like predicted oxidoreductase